MEADAIDMGVGGSCNACTSEANATGYRNSSQKVEPSLLELTPIRPPAS